METRALRNENGTSIISTLIAAGIIVGSIAAVVFPAMKLQEAMRKTEVSNVAIIAEAELISAFHNKLNFPDAGAWNETLRAGTLPATMTLVTAFSPLQLTRPGTANYLSASGFLNRTASPCAAFDHQCVVSYEVRMGKPAGSSSFAFTYQISVNPAVSNAASMGKLATYTATTPPEDGFSPIDPGLYRVGYIKNICDDASDVFVSGINRDTGEAFCVAKPTVNKCPDRTLPTGLAITSYPDSTKAGTLTLTCTPPMRTMSCPTNYSLQMFHPKYVDPRVDDASMTSPPGRCVFRTRTNASVPASLGTFPPNPTAPYLRTVSGTFCPPYYKAGNPGSCQLVPHTAKNSSDGQGRCATKAYKNCSRLTWRDEVLPGGGVSRTCSRTQVSASCDGNVTNGEALCPGGAVDGWSAGTEYGIRSTAHTVYPSAQPQASFPGGGRTASCTFTDTTPFCDTPDRDFDGISWGKKQAKWYGGVQILGTSCTLDLSLVPEITKPALPGG